uniref:I-set domain-containing protein n=1 Tax=Glossina austeni TaxID=7395 RepID=A0A1A9V0P9_GLOAU
MELIGVDNWDKLSSENLRVDKDIHSAHLYFCTLEITNVTVEDAGKYRVAAQNVNGETNATICLNFSGYACVCKYEEFMNNVNCSNTDILYLGDETPLPENGVKATFVERPIIVQKDDNSLRVLYLTHQKALQSQKNEMNKDIRWERRFLVKCHRVDKD